MRAIRPFIFPLLALGGFLAASTRADHFRVALELASGPTHKTAATETEPPGAREIVVRPTMESPASARCTAKFKIVCTSKTPVNNALVHFYVVKVDKIGQSPPPLEPKDVLIETAQTIDFAEGATTSAELQFTPDKPGIYLVRVETQGTAEAKNHEHYAAIDLVVK